MSSQIKFRQYTLDRCTGFVGSSVKSKIDAVYDLSQKIKGYRSRETGNYMFLASTSIDESEHITIASFAKCSIHTKVKVTINATSNGFEARIVR